MRLRVVILGCGAIAGGSDAARSGDAARFTHAGAYNADGRFEIVGCVDPVRESRETLAARWKVPVAADRAANLGIGGVDIVSICSGTRWHEDNIADALGLKPRLIFCEKPMTGSVAASERVVAACRAANVLLAVNHTRRWAPDIASLRDTVRSGRRGRLLAISGLYAKGMLNNGSHLIDLIHYLTDTALEVRWAGVPVPDYTPSDPARAAALETTAGVPVLIATGDAREYAAFELTLVFASGVVSIEDGGRLWRERSVVDSPDFSGYKVLDRGALTRGAQAEAMGQAVANLHDALRTGAALISTGDTALAAQRICERIGNWPSAGNLG